MKKVKKIYIENTLYYGTDSKNKNKIIYAFEPLRIIERGDFYTVVKKRGRGQQRMYLVKNDLIEYEV